MTLTIEDLCEDLEVFGVHVNDDIKEKCLRICEQYSISGDQLAVQWITFAAANGYEEITGENFAEFKNEVSKKYLIDSKTNNEDVSTPVSARKNESSSLPLAQLDDDLISTYDASPIVSKVCKQETPISSNGGKRLQFSQSYEELKGSPLAPSLSQSPLSQKSAKYAERSNSGTVVSSYGTSNLHYTGEISSKCEVKQLPCSNNSNFVSAYKFMFERLRDCVAVLDDSIYEFGSNILQKHNQEIEEFTSFSHLGNEPIWCLGQICCDSVGKLNSASVVLQGDTDFGQGEFIKLDLSRLQSYSLFPGQIVAVKGINATGHCFTVHEIISGDILPLYPMAGSSNSGAVQVLIASGPFTTRDNLLYEPLMDLINVALKNPPNVLLLLGPLLDISHPCVEHSTFEDSFDTVIARLLDKINSAFSGTSTQVYIVASHQDACCVPVYPTPPVLSADPNNCGVRILPDPCFIDIDGTSLGLTTLDVPLHLSREEINFKPKNMDRLSRLSEHLLRQQIFYPLHPGPQGLPVDVRRKDIHCRLPFTPHVMVTPSDLKGFLKEVHGCLFVNPDRMTKGSSGGCFCTLTILPGSSQHPVISAQIVKI